MDLNLKDLKHQGFAPTDEALCLCLFLCVCEDCLTSLQRVLSDRLAVHPQARSSVGSHLDLILRPDDELSNQTVINLCTGDVLQLKLTRQTRQSVPEWEGERKRMCFFWKLIVNL